jgi:hypothetical protein
MDADYFGEYSNTHMPRDLALRDMLSRWQRDTIQSRFRITSQSGLNLFYLDLQGLSVRF